MYVLVLYVLVCALVLCVLVCHVMRMCVEFSMWYLTFAWTRLIDSRLSLASVIVVAIVVS